MKCTSSAGRVLARPWIQLPALNKELRKEMREGEEKRGKMNKAGRVLCTL